ncbi:MAG TPA: nucleotidyltransferase domain-containing protein [Candidatus Acidoferrales bacterium]|jgi:predicted nucleotidyltransferase|nr:nucleotidyltransferase domain-containing protein [Candidatus Acidoferrales bacterium]
MTSASGDPISAQPAADRDVGIARDFTALPHYSVRVRAMYDKLFGSTARGDAGPDSDYDLMIVLPDDTPAGKKDPGIGYTAVEGLPRSGDFLIRTRRNFDSRLHLKASLPSTILREGMLLYAA